MPEEPKTMLGKEAPPKRPERPAEPAQGPHPHPVTGMATSAGALSSSSEIQRAALLPSALQDFNTLKTDVSVAGNLIQQSAESGIEVEWICPYCKGKNRGKGYPPSAGFDCIICNRPSRVRIPS